MIFFLLVFIQIVIFGGLVFFLRHLIKQNIGSASSHLEALAQEAREKLSEAKRKVDEADSFYSSTLMKAKDEGDQAKQQLIEEGMKLKQEALEQVRKQSEEIVERAQTAAQLIKEDLETKINQEAAQKTSVLVRQILSGKMTEETQVRWVSDLIKMGLDGLNRLQIPHEVKEIEIVSAFALKPAEKALLLSRLKEKLGREIATKESVDPDLILGVRLKIGNIVLDGSFQHQVQEALKNG